MDKKLIINADDFGLCEGVNKAVAKAHTDGVLTSTTIMANMPAADDAAQIARELPSLGLGVHLKLTGGRALSSRPALRPLLNARGEFTASAAKVAFFTVTPIIRAAVKAEFAAQIQWVIDKGLHPTHLDSHKHIHTVPHIFSIVCQLARRFGIPAIRFAYEPKQVSVIPWPLPAKTQKQKAALVRAMASINHIQNRDFLKTDATLGIAHTGKIDVNFFRAVALYNPARVAEVMTHPGFLDGLDPQQTRLVNQRKVELDALCSEKTRRYFDDAGINLVNYGQI